MKKRGYFEERRVPPVSPLFDVEYNVRKKETRKDTLAQSPPTKEEAALIHQMYLEQHQYGIPLSLYGSHHRIGFER
jgi:hypothetical protein